MDKDLLRIKELYSDESAQLLRRYKKYVSVADSLKPLSDIEKITLSMLLDNTAKQLARYKQARNLSDATFSSSVGPFVRHVFNIVTAYYTTLDLKKIISIQPMQQKIGALYFLNYKFADNKGAIQSGDTLFSPLSRPKYTGYYSTNIVNGEVIEFSGTTDSQGVLDVSGTLSYYPVISPEFAKAILKLKIGQSVTTVNLVYSGVVNNLVELRAVGNNDVSLKIDLSTGGVTVIWNNLNANTSCEVSGSVTYKYNSEVAARLGLVSSNSWNPRVSNIPKITISIDELLVHAERRNLLFDIMLDASYDVTQQFGRNINLEIEGIITQSLQNEFSYLVLDEMLNGAINYNEYLSDSGVGGSNAPIPYFNTYPGTQKSVYQHAESMLDFLSHISAIIFNNYGRGLGNIIVCGINVAKFLQILPSTMWKSTHSGEIKGPTELGVLSDKWTVFVNPAYEPNTFMMSYRGSDWWEAPYVAGVYLPLMSSNFMMFPDMHGEQGYISMEARKLLFPGQIVLGKFIHDDSSNGDYVYHIPESLKNSWQNASLLLPWK